MIFVILGHHQNWNSHISAKWGPHAISGIHACDSRLMGTIDRRHRGRIKPLNMIAETRSTDAKRIHKFHVSRGVRYGAAALTIALMTGIVTPAAMAQTIPLPRPAPRAREAAPGALIIDNRRPPVGSVTAATTTPPTPLIPDPRSRVQSSIFTTFDNVQRAQAAKVSAYLSSLQNVTGNFVQVGPDGSRSTGSLYIQKPGRVRFTYDPPSPIAIIADGSSVVIRDQRLSTQDVYPLSQTPLRFLLSDRLDLMRDSNVVGVTADDLFISITIEENQPLVGTSRLILMVGAKDNQLKQWTITDPQGYDTTIAVYNLDTSKRIDSSLFKIDYSDRNVQ
jgi:outer membrane lipoprotein-sorting protein